MAIKILRYAAWFSMLLLTGCVFMPEVGHQPQIHNPFPQLTKVAVAPFFNLTTEPTLDGRKVALAYFNELQSVPGFEVVPVGVVETAMREANIQLTGPNEARRLAQILKVDAVVVGAVTDYTPYYPPRIALQTEWYAANPGFHQIPPGYGLPWGTPGEKEIPAPLVFEAEMALAKAQLKTQTPPMPATPVSKTAQGEVQMQSGMEPVKEEKADSEGGKNTTPMGGSEDTKKVQSAQYTVSADATDANGIVSPNNTGLPENWPDPKGFIPAGPKPFPPESKPTNSPVLRHTKTYNATDADFTAALQNYYKYRDDGRFGGWQNYLQRSDDFIRFCCHMHISEMLTARGGAGESRVVWRWSSIR